MIQSRPSAQWANSATSPAVAKVPTVPSAATGSATVRKRRNPIEAPPSNRITTSATVPIHSTACVDGARDGTASDAAAATMRNTAAEGSGRRSLWC